MISDKLKITRETAKLTQSKMKINFVFLLCLNHWVIFQMKILSKCEEEKKHAKYLKFGITKSIIPRNYKEGFFNIFLIKNIFFCILLSFF